jgi:hypothetical protein
MAADTSFSLLIGNSMETRKVRAGGVILRRRAIYLADGDRMGTMA